MLFVTAPINAVLYSATSISLTLRNYALVWETSLGFYGAPMAVAVLPFFVKSDIDIILDDGNPVNPIYHVRSISDAATDLD